MWGSVWMRNMFMVFVFYQGKKNCSLFCLVCVLCCVAFSLGCLLIGFVLFTSFIVLICCWVLQQIY